MLLGGARAYLFRAPDCASEPVVVVKLDSLALVRLLVDLVLIAEEFLLDARVLDAADVEVLETQTERGGHEAMGGQ